MSHISVSDEFLLWSQMCLLWSVSSYAIAPDPLPEDRDNRQLRLANLENISAIRIFEQRFQLRDDPFDCSERLADNDNSDTSVDTSSESFEMDRRDRGVGLNFKLPIHACLCETFSLAIACFRSGFSQHGTPLRNSIVGATVLFVFRGGTYVVRGCLRKTGTLLTLPPRTLPKRKKIKLM